MKNRRKKRSTHHQVQKNFLKLVICAMFGPTLIVAGCLYYLIWQTVAYEIAVPELIDQVLYPAFWRVNQILLVGIPIISGLILYFALQFAHRIAGPINRVERELDTMIRANNFRNPIRIRTKDDLAPLVQKINRALKHAREQKN